MWVAAELEPLMTVEFLTTGDICGAETRVGSPRGFLYVTLCLSALVPTLFVMGYLAGFIGPKPGSLSDSDCYVHLLRVERLWQTGRWYDPILERSNAPHGEVLHWTRPFDVLLLLGGAAGSPFAGLRASLFWWGVILSPVLLGVTLGVLPWVLRPLVGRDGSFIVGLILICQMGTWLVFQAGRPDHHGLLLLLFILVLGYTLRMVTLPLSTSVCWGAGITAALALWTSIESILMIGLSLFMLTALWIGRGGDFHRKILYYGVALLTGLGVALVVERPPADLGAVEFDRLSIAHCAILGAVVGVCAIIVVCHDRSRQPWPVLVRLLAVACGAAICLLFVARFAPLWYKGPLAGVDPEVTRIYVQNVAEMEPLLASGPGRSMAVTVLASAALCAPLLFRRIARGPRIAGWVYVTAALAAFIPLAFHQIRWVSYVQALLVIPFTEIILAAWARLDRRPYTFQRTLAKTGVLVACCYFLLFFGLLFDAIWGAVPENDRDDHPALASICRYLTEAPPYAGHSLRILADVFWGGEILYRTPHEVIGTPYHRNTEGIRDTHSAFSAAMDDEALQVIRQRRIDLILVAPGSERVRRFYCRQEAGSTFYQRLCDGQVPDWCRPVRLPAGLDSFRLFEIHLH
jgi:hypothetical protein